jgi:hypothetical protein
MVEARHHQLDEIKVRSRVPELKWPEVKKAQFLYSGVIDGLEVDSLMVLFEDNRPATSADANVPGSVIVRYDPDTGEVIGIEIDGFEQHFLRKFRPDLAAGWAAIKPPDDDGFHNGQWLTNTGALDYALNLRDIAHSGTLAPGWPIAGLDSA